jgi:hypothetical protein
MNLFQQIRQIPGDIQEGFKTADRVQQKMINDGVGYGESVLDPRFKTKVAEQGISARGTPAKFLGAYASRMLIDAANDGTRTYWWRYNHPLAIAQRGLEAGVNRSWLQSPTARAAVALGIAAPAVAAAGTYDITNPEEQFRPKGFAQTYSQPGTDDRRKTQQPAQEMFERFFLGRTGDPLKYETAKKEIPDLTPRRYGNYMDYLYNDKGLLGLGVIKGTTENLQGTPEVRLLGFPANIPMAAGFAAGTTGAVLAGKGSKRLGIPGGKTPMARAARGLAGGLIGSLTGVAAGNVVNEQIAAGNRPQLPTVNNYQNISADRI